MRPNVSSLAVILGQFSLAQAAAYDRRQVVATNSVNLADGFMNMFRRVGGAQTVTETVRQTITVGGAGAFGRGTNSTGTVTVTITAAASTITVCPGQANGAVEGVQGDASTSAAAGGAAGSAVAPPPVIASGGIGVTTIPVPAEARKTSAAGNQPVASQPAATNPAASQPAVTAPTASQSSATDPAASQPTATDPAASQPTATDPAASQPTATDPAASQPTATDPAASQPAASSGSAGAGPSLAPLPAQGGETQPGLVPPPALSTASPVSSLSTPSPLQTPPGLTSPTSVPIVGAPVSETSALASGPTLAPAPGLASSLSDTLSLPGAGNAAVPTVLPNPEGAFGGSVGLIPMVSASVPPPSPTTPGIANGAGAAPTINVSGLTLSSQLKLGNLVQQTATRSA